LELHGPAMGSSPERGKRGKEEGSRGALLGVRLGRGRAVGGAPWGLGAAASVRSTARSAAVHEKKGGRRREEKKRKEKKREKRKNMENFPNLKNKRQFMELIKIFWYKKGIILIINK
jgi:hypothetical protein